MTDCVEEEHQNKLEENHNAVTIFCWQKQAYMRGVTLHCERIGSKKADYTRVTHQKGQKPLEALKTAAEIALQGLP